MKILETTHDRVKYWLIFDNLEIVAKFDTLEKAETFIKIQNGKRI